MQQRYYDPVAGRFLSVDPVTTNASTGSFFNRYEYAKNNPYKFKDPDGRSPCTGTRIASACGTGYNTAPIGDAGAGARAAANNVIAQRVTSEINSAGRGARNLWNIIVAAVTGGGEDAPASPEIKPDDLRDRSKDELEAQAKDKGLVQDVKKPNRWRDPANGRERMRIDPGHVDPKTGRPYENPRAAVPHAHGYDAEGRKIGDPQAGNDPHFPLRP
jgi:uncharacterized protein RhaS with RHS repeats